MKHYLFKIAFIFTLIVLFLGKGGGLYADEIIVGTPGSANTNSDRGVPFYYLYCSGWSETLYTQSVLSSFGVEEGDIQSVAIQIKTNPGSRVNWGNLKIWLANTSNSTGFASGKSVKENADYTLVYSQTNFTIPANLAVNSWITFPCDVPFSYTGDGLLLYICYEDTQWTGSTYGFDATSTTTGFCHFNYTDNLGYCGINYIAANPTYRLNIKMEIDMGPSIKEISPSEMKLYGANSLTGNIIAPYVKFARKPIEPPIQMSYCVKDATGNIVFEALDPVTNSTWIDVRTSLVSTGVAPNTTPATLYFKNARGFLADVSNPDTAKITFRKPGVAEGVYTVEAKLRYTKPGAPPVNKLQEKEAFFEVAYSDDISLVDMVEPLSEDKYQYAYSNQPILMAIKIENRGVNDISNFITEYILLQDNSATGRRDTVWKYKDTTNLTTPLKRGQSMSKDLDKLVPSHFPNLKPGTSYLVVNLILLNAPEENLSNNGNKNNPRPIKLVYPYDGIVENIITPVTPTTGLENYFQNQPILPKVMVKNAGGFDAYDIPIEIKVYQGNTTQGTAVVYNTVAYVPFLAKKGDERGRDVAEFEVPTAFIPKEVGNYVIEITISEDGDPDITTNKMSKIFSVASSLSGNYTVGASSTYKTIEEALNAVYTRGVSGTVTFILSDPVLNVGSINSEYAADFSSSISGFNTATDKIRFVPSQSLSRLKGGVTLRLNSKSGFGFRFGSSVAPPFANAPIYKVQSEHRRVYYPFNAVVEFDGGSNKSIRFVTGDVPTSQTNNAPLYFSEGASNITIKNCIVEGSKNGTEVPLTLWNRERNDITYDDMNNLSACILIRNVPPMDNMGLNKVYNLDTLINRNIVIEKNSIENGGYGVLSLGIGGLYNVGEGKILRYYNFNNHIINNDIIGQTRAGIYMGYEENSRIANNRIYFIGSDITSNKDVAGIMLGGDGRGDKFGYNNIGLTVDGNEISFVRSNKDVYGIKIEQERNYYYDLHILNTKAPFIPNVDDSIKLFNNIVWDVKSNNSNGSRYGIRLFTTRDRNILAPLTNFVTQKELTYNITGCAIVNNSIIIEDDGLTNGTDAYVAGLAMQNINEVVVLNNAINLLDINAGSEIVAPLVLESVNPAFAKIDINNNIYFTATPNDGLIRFIELSRKDNSLMNLRYRNEFPVLDQWQYLSGTDKMSTVYNFLNDVYKTTDKYPKVRVKSPVPVGSYLNNRGVVFVKLNKDIDGNPRGAADQAYDIGAWEFSGGLYDNDLGVLNFVSPVSYKDNRVGSDFADAEYVMTTNPVSIKINIRNNGSVLAENKPVKISIYNTESTTPNVPVIEFYETFTIGAFELKTLDFRTDDKSLSNRWFAPKSYSETNIAVPARFATMANNVTPVYKIVVELPVDEDLTNNKSVDKLVRFYIKKSELHLLISGEHTTLVANSVADHYKYIKDNLVVETDEELNSVAAFSNYKALRNAFEKLGFSLQSQKIIQVAGKDTLVTVSGFDVFDRTNWEPHSVNYLPYNTIFWADALNSRFNEYTEQNINDFLAPATLAIKKNLIVSSEELARNSYMTYFALGQEDYFQKLFNTVPKGNGERTSNFDQNGKDWITGSLINQNFETSFANTTLFPEKDVALVAGIFDQATSSTRIVGQAFFYNNPAGQHRNIKTMGTISYTSKDFLFYLGLDWRHYSNPEFILSGIIDFIDNKGGTIVPVQLLNFEAIAAGQKVYLNWQTASETNSDKFIVERANVSSAGKSVFSSLSEVKAAGVSMAGADYSAVDANTKPGETYAYRLKFVDLDGSYSYSDERIVSISSSSSLLSFDAITPSPAVDLININFETSSEGNVKISIYDISGREMAVVTNRQFGVAQHSLTYSIAGLSAGSYTVVLSANESSLSQVFTIIK